MYLGEGGHAAPDVAGGEHSGGLTPAARHIPGIDLWRALLMLGGIVLHASVLKREQPLFLAIEIVSGSFRMGAFFVLSGLLTGFALRKQADPSRWFRRRLVRLGVPTMFGLLVICPLLDLFINAMLGPSFPVFSLHHLWFLVALLLYTGAVFLLEDAERRSATVTRLVAGLVRMEGEAGPLGIVLTVAALSTLLMVGTAQASGPLSGPSMLKPGLQIFGDAPMFLLGYFLSRSQPLRATLLATPRVPLLVIGAVVMAYAAWFGLLAHRVEPELAARGQFYLRVVGAACCAPAAALLILRSALRIRHVPLLFQSFAEASFTIYIVHFPLLAAFNIGFKHIHWDPYLEYGIAGVVGGLLSYAFHRRVVRRFGWAAFLFNGETRRRQTAMA
jgi:glucans biosynthesis protein C